MAFAVVNIIVYNKPRILFFMLAILSEKIWLYATPSESNSQFLDLQVKQTIPISQIYSIKDSHRVT